MMNTSILIVEDEFIVAEDLQLTLQKAGYNVCGIADGVAEAREIISSKKPSLVLLDIHLKGKETGVDLARELKEQQVAFVYLSANSNQKILEQAKATEPYGFLVKPFREKDLLMTLEIAFYRHQHSLEARWRNELVLQKELYAVENSIDSAEQKLLSTAKILQQYISFDMMVVKYKLPNKSYLKTGFLRIGFDEYQVIGTKELSVITGLKEDSLSAIAMADSHDYTPAVLNAKDFEKAFTKKTFNSLLANQFQFLSALLFPVLIGEGNIASFTFFTKKAGDFSDRQLNLFSGIMMPLLGVLKSINASQNNFLQTTSSSVASSTPDAFRNIIGSSAALLNVLDLVTQVGPVDTSVLLLGESGTGKEKIATAIHELSPRKDKPFIKINCSALPQTLIESELFGHEKGSFTNAIDKRIGKFELASSGTIFLDEIGEMPLELQVKLLRVLQEKEIERLGGKNTIKVDVRIIAATNRNLQEEMANGKFRLDLYYRLNVFPITLPCLRERKEDIKALSEYFAASFSKKFNKAYPGIGKEMLEELMDYDFPGNIRELENIIEQSVILNDGKTPLTLRQPLQLNDKKSMQTNSIQTMDDLKRLQRQTEIEHISSVLVKTKGRIRGKDGAAELLNEKPTTLESRMQKLGIKKEDFQ